MLAALIIYAVALKNMFVWSDSLIIHEISMCLIRKLMIACSNMFLQNQEHSVKQIIKKINKFKNSIILKKVLTAYRLSSNDILIIMNTVEIKKQLKHSKYWLLIVSQITKINHHKFTVLVHEVCMFALDCSKQNTVIKKLLDQNQYFQSRMKFLHVCWLRRMIKLSKSVFYLIVNIIILMQVNLLINNKLLFHSKLKDCELYYSDCRLTQCFNY